MSPDVHIVIPARYASTRLPGKVLLDLGGQPLLQRTWSAASNSGYEVWVAVDDARVQSAVEAFGGRSLMTPSELRSGTERVAYVARHRAWPADDIVVNVQADEPFFPPSYVGQLVEPLVEDPSLGMSSLACRIDQRDQIFSEHCVKVVCNLRGDALYFSRAPIPWVRGGMAEERAPSGFYLRHIGAYAYRVGMLIQLADLPEAPSEVSESLEQLRALHHGISIRIRAVDSAPPPGIDTPADLERARALLSEHSQR
ncbi:MAG: 3-deoxy-manno-octulosonate cytidylyltransferase [Polyangiaceae bacterium]|nr:3-deoxy-manno-octulosonate cytidylyltransferase [Myxococcales bacterium]MCB9589057.1 3-deoxy-manno-octulosonate cytidylyltransferase [Polyangiaceae bacterium]